MQSIDLKICFVIPSLSSGGAERVVSVLASELAEQGYSVEVVVYFRSENEYPICNRVKLVCLSNGDESVYKRIKFNEKIKRLRRIIGAFAPDYVIPFLPHVAAHTVLSCVGLKTRIVQTIRNAPQISPQSRPQRMLRNFLVCVSYKTFAQTQEQKAYFPKLVQKKVFVLPNPVYGGFLSAERPVHEEIRKVVSVGRLTEQKNFTLVIDAVIRLHRKYEELQLSIYGEGELHDYLEKYIDKKGGSGFCYLRGRSDNLLDVYMHNDVFVLSSNFEGMPNALMEAMATGIPCISTDCKTGPSDLIDNGRSGFLIPVRSEKNLIESLEWMIANPEAAHNMGEKAKETVAQKFSARTISESLLMNLKNGRN